LLPLSFAYPLLRTALAIRGNVDGTANLAATGLAVAEDSNREAGSNTRDILIVQPPMDLEMEEDVS
jgi:hypothetical protein